MQIRIGMFLGILISIAIISGAAANQTANSSEENATVIGDTANTSEALMNLALEARAYALENGKLAAKWAFSDQASFVKDSMYITAYDTKGVLLADPFNPGKIGTKEITDDHDTGIVRQLRDIAQSGGGMLAGNLTESGGRSYYALDIDGSWWLVAVSGR